MAGFKTGTILPVIIPTSTVTIQVGPPGVGPTYPAPAAPWSLPTHGRDTPGPVDLEPMAEPGVSYADVATLAMDWTRLREHGNACGVLPEPRHDVNHDGCLNVADLQVVAAQLAEPEPATSTTTSTPLTFVVNAIDVATEVAYGSWQGARDLAAYAGSYRSSDTAGASVVVTMSGASFTWITARGPEMGEARVVVDGVPLESVDLYAPSLEWQHQHVVSGLSDGQHVVEIQVMGTHQSASTGNTIVFDAILLP